MADHDGDKPKPRRTPPSRRGIAPANAWPKGVSGNPAGRPRAGLAFAERVRERVDPDMVIELALRVAQDEDMTPQERLATLWPLIDRGYVKPPAGLDVAVSQGDARAYDVSKLSTEECRALLEKIDAAELHAGNAPAALPVDSDT